MAAPREVDPRFGDVIGDEAGELGTGERAHVLAQHVPLGHGGIVVLGHVAEVPRSVVHAHVEDASHRRGVS